MRGTHKMAACLLLLLAFCVPVARAVGTVGSLTIQMTWNGRAVAGGSLTLYEVGQSWQGETSPQAVERAMKYVKEQSVQGVMQSVGQGGSALFVGLEQGVYLLVQHESAPGFRPINPFLVCIGEGEGRLANPKLTPDNAPETGDKSAAVLWLTLMAVSLVAAGGIFLYKKRKGSSKP